jgi:hypothetical protein
MPKKKTAARTPATTLRIEELHSINQFIELVQEGITRAGGALWYRGCCDQSHGLIPTLYRHPTTLDAPKLIALETKILSRFKQRSVPYQLRPLTSSWEHLFFMQHFGIPTRLLDWTENPYVGLYFALCGKPDRYTAGTPVYDSDAALWMLDPVAWNRKALEDIDWSGDVLTPGDDAPLSGYEPFQLPTMIRNYPVAIYGTHNSYRIVAQRGVFVIFGKSLLSMEETYRNLRFPPDTLLKITIPRTKIGSLMKELFDVGITDSVVFPDLDGLAKEIKRNFGFKI